MTQTHLPTWAVVLCLLPVYFLWYRFWWRFALKGYRDYRQRLQRIRAFERLLDEWEKR